MLNQVLTDKEVDFVIELLSAESEKIMQIRGTLTPDKCDTNCASGCAPQTA